MEMTSALTSLAALGHESRLRAFRRLVETGPAGMAVGELREFLELPAATLTAHLNVLRSAQLVSDQREGRVIRVRANYAQMNELLAYLTENCCAGASDCSSVLVCAPTRKKRASR
jgi:ArsR family transcriptional regulator